ncbi:J domain-containing protein [Fulvivirga sp. 29W222]|uniref:J domain-containing protein n=1 Tax=Fulvivirga marina TaxID=2494733 RepID=A0A937G2I7_9BACT|nr:DnaJ domain-containing protein [Fulvivirga marina]MBL6449046.1 J domain-containing protein [Fulvivirga marina]
MRDNYYHILGLDNFASQSEIKSAYRRLAKKYHPDKNSGDPDSEEKFKRVNKAYKVLTNPAKKPSYDQLLKQQIAAPNSPNYAPRQSHYTTEKRKYTPTAWMLARVFIIAFIMAIILIPIGLIYKSSITSYERGMEALQKQEYYQSLNHFDRAITTFGGRAVEAGIEGGKICIYNLHNYEQGLYFVNRGLEHAERQSQFAELYYLKALSYKGLSNYEESMKALSMADSLQYTTDSLELQLGLLHAFGLHEFNKGEKNFNYLIEHNIHLQTALFGKAWCLQNQERYREAAITYSKVIEMDPSHAISYYYRGLNEISYYDSSAACQDFANAMELGYYKAETLFKYHCE